VFKNQKSLILFALIEGISISAYELTFGKLISEFYGSTSEIWAVILGVTMLFLALGYYFGARLSAKEGSKFRLKTLATIGVLFFLIAVWVSEPLMQKVFAAGFIPGAVISTILLIGPGMLLFSMINPIIIEEASENERSTGRLTGIVFAISSVSGVLIALFTGLYLLPSFGKTNSILIISSMLLVLVFFSGAFKETKINAFLISLGLTVVVGLMCVINFNAKPVYINHDVVYQNEGMLGEIMVLDHYHGSPYRELVVNNIPQSAVFLDSFTSLGIYVHRISMTASMKPPGSNALIVGMGGGSLVEEFTRLGHNIDVVDIDSRMFDVAKNHFKAPVEGVNCIQDDVRHYLRTAKKKYDIVVFDLSLAETQPSHVYTKEGFKDLEKLLKDEQSFVMIHYIDRSKNKIASRSIAATLDASDYKVRGLSFHPEYPEVAILMALKADPDPTKFTYGRHNACCTKFGPPERMLQTEEISFKGALVLTDDKPLLDVLNREMVKESRTTMMNIFIKHLEEDETD